MTEELYINGELMDLDAGFKGVQMVFQSPYLTDLKSIVSNRTNSVTLPATQRNKAIIGCTSLQEQNTFAYRKHRAIYKREGVQMFDGSATLLSVTDTQIQMCFTWGNVDAFQRLFDMRLRDLAAYNEREQYIQYNAPYGDLQLYYSMPVDCGLGRKQPALLASRIISRIQSACGVSGLSNVNDWKYLGVLLTTNRGDEHTKYEQGVNYGTLALKCVTVSENYRITAIVKGSDSSDAHNSMDSDGVIDVTSASKLRVKLSGTLEVTQPMTVAGGYQMWLLLDKGNGFTLSDGIKIADGINEGVVAGGARKYKYVLDYDQTIDVEKAQYACIIVSYDIDSYDPSILVNSLSSRLILDPSISEEVIWGTSYSITPYPMWHNLPDMSCGDFIKSLMLPFGLFAYCKTDNRIEFTSFAELYTNRTRALDWTDKMLKRYPTNIQTKIDGYARNNFVKYKADEGVVEGSLDGVIVCDDENLEAEKTLYENPFTLPQYDFVPLWTSNEDGTIDFTGDERVPRLIGLYESSTPPQYVQRLGYQSRLAWSNVLTKYYTEYQRVVNKPVVIKADFLITTADLNALDMRVPVYLKQTGRYYAIRKLTTKNAKVAEAELIELK